MAPDRTTEASALAKSAAPQSGILADGFGSATEPSSGGHRSSREGKDESGGGMARGDEQAGRTVRVNRAPVLTLWAAVVAGRLGLDQDEALTFGRALAGVTAYAKGVRLGVIEPSPERVTEERDRLKHGEEISLRLMGRLIPAVRTPEGLRAVAKGKPITPGSVARYLKGKFGDDLAAVRTAMEALASSMPPETLARRAFSLYEQFRPAVKPGAEGWGAEGELDTERIAKLAAER